MKRLLQRHFFSKRIASLREHGLELEIRDISLETTHFFAYQEITKESRRVTVRRGAILFVGAVLVLVNLTLLSALLSRQPDKWVDFLLYAAITSAVISVLAWLVYLLSAKSLLILKTTTGREIELFNHKAGQQGLAEFLTDLYTARNTYFRSNFFFIDYESNREAELDKMAWLLEEGVITESEFEVVKEEIENTLE